MKRNSGEIVTGLLIGLAVGAAMAFVAASNEAKHQATLSGADVSVMSVMASEPGKYSLQAAVPAVAGAGLGWLVESVNDQSSGERYEISVTADQSAIVIGDGAADQEQVRDLSNVPPVP